MGKKPLMFYLLIVFSVLFSAITISFGAIITDDPGNLTAYRGQNDTVMEFSVIGSIVGSLWGTEVYTDDSNLAIAAVHAGVLKPGEQGIVEVIILPGQSSYEGSTQFGIISRPYGAYHGSYRVVGFKRETVPTLPNPGNMTAYRGRNEENFKFLVLGSGSGQFWGTDIYTDDSLLSLAAVHTGALQVGEYGIVTVTVLPGQDNYIGSYRNGLSSSNYGKWHGSFLLKRYSGEEAVEPRGTIKAVESDPGDLTAYRKQTGHVLTFFVTGSKAGSIWGTGIYTDDSTLAVVCVHAGLLQPGENGVIEVTLLPGLEHYEGSTLNGITSQSYGGWQWSYFVKRAQ